MSPIPAKVRRALKRRAGAELIGDYAMCELCGKNYGTNAHHRRNQSQGGQHILSNLMWLCGTGTTLCHGWVTGDPAMAIRNGWTIPNLDHEGSQVEPWRVPVRRRGELVHLYDDGSVMPSDWEGEVA
jgi:hypothetical protein